MANLKRRVSRKIPFKISKRPRYKRAIESILLIDPYRLGLTTAWATDPLFVAMHSALITGSPAEVGSHPQFSLQSTKLSSSLPPPSGSPEKVVPNLLKLPAELRELIYHFLLVHGLPNPVICILASDLPPTFTLNILSYVEDADQYLRSGDRIDTTVLRVNKQLKSEAGYYFYSRSRFRTNSTQLLTLMSSPDIFGWLRHLEIEDVETVVRQWDLGEVIHTLAASSNIKSISLGTTIFGKWYNAFEPLREIKNRSTRQWDQQENVLNEEWDSIKHQISVQKQRMDKEWERWLMRGDLQHRQRRRREGNKLLQNSFYV
ncbi:MAG: hypothetical protein MMC33_004412 [Icmadophila ericetorum]|nr:hypothetical protein [Icmadophila ericetorum]